jgi:putative transposase
MPYDPDRHRRRSIRLPGYDYTRAGAYFVTVCVADRLCLLGEVVEEGVALSPAGQMVADRWRALPERFDLVEVDEFVVMPNHLHGILVLQDPVVGAGLVPALPEIRRNAMGARAPTRGAPTLGDAVGAFKSLTTVNYSRGVRGYGWRPFERRLWQRGYWERVLRNGRKLDFARRYIRENPLRWHLDRLHPGPRRGVVHPALPSRPLLAGALRQ